MENSKSMAINRKNKMSSSMDETVHIPFLFNTNSTINDFCESEEQDFAAIENRVTIYDLRCPILEAAPRNEHHVAEIRKKNGIPANVPFNYALRPTRKFGGEVLLYLYEYLFQNECNITPLKRDDVVQNAPWLSRLKPIANDSDLPLK